MCAATSVVAATALAEQAAAETLYSKTFFGDSSGQFVSPSCKDDVHVYGNNAAIRYQVY